MARYRKQPEEEAFQDLVFHLCALTNKPKAQRLRSERRHSDSILRALMVWLDMSGSYHPNDIFSNRLPRTVKTLRAVAKKEGFK